MRIVLNYKDDDGRDSDPPTSGFRNQSQYNLNSSAFYDKTAIMGDDGLVKY